MRLAIVVGSLFLLAACGAPKPTTVVVPLTPEQSKAFDNGVDFVTSLEGLEGRWRDDWENDLQVRVATSDLIATVTVRTLLTQTDLSQRPTYRLVAHVDREMVGEEKDKELELSVGEQQVGYLTVRENMNRIADKQYVVYLKRGTETGVSWHLSPASDQVITETESKITQLSRAPKKDTGERVIVHTN